MVPPNNIKRYWIGYILVLAISLAGCYTNNGPCKGCATTSFSPDVNLRIVDKASRQDLFFGPDAKYNLSLLRIKHMSQGVADSIPAAYTVDSAKRLLNLKLHYQAAADTIAIQVGTLRPRLLVIYTGTLNNCCARVVVTEAKYQDSLIFMAPVDPVRLAKVPNRLTVPF